MSWRSFSALVSAAVPLWLIGSACASSEGADEARGALADDDTDSSRGSDAGIRPPGAAGDASTSPDASVPTDPRAAEMHERADRAAGTMMVAFWEKLRTQDNSAGYWTYAHDWDVLLDAAERRGPAAYSGAIAMFYDTQDAKGWTREYYDDENWMTLTLVRAFDLTGDARYLSRARAIFDHIMTAWDETCCGKNKGGIWWRTAKDSKVTAINAGAVVSAARLYERTKVSSYLDFAKKTFAYWSTYMVDPGTSDAANKGHVFDGISSAGELNTTWAFTYNEGLMIGAALALAKADVNGGAANASRIALAHQIAGYMLSKESASVDGGTILSDGKCGKPGGDDGEQFKGIGARYLAALYEADRSHDEYREFLVRSADSAWNHARDAGSGLISCDWAGPYDPNTNSVNSLSSAAMTFAVTAKILGPATPRPALEYEAEEGYLHGVGLESSHAGFSGFGYVAGWKGEGQWVDFLVEVPAAGTYDLDIRYAGEDASSRLVHANGANILADLAFPSTGSYDTYASVTTTVPLVAGKNTVSLIYNAGFGSHGYVNLDRIRLAKR